MEAVNKETTKPEHESTEDLDLDVCLVGAIYRSREREIGLLQRFADELTDQGWRIGGVVQEVLKNEDGSKAGLDAVDLDTKQRMPINRPTKATMDYKTCSLDTQALAETSTAIQRAVDQKMDLILVEKFGEQEQLGLGLSGDILHAVSNGIPTLVAVPDGVRDKWSEFTGDLGDEIPFELEAFHAWWEKVCPDRKT